MATYSYSKAQLDRRVNVSNKQSTVKTILALLTLFNKRDQPAKPFWSLKKIGVAAAAFTVTCVAISANQSVPVAVAPAAPVAVAPAAPVVVAPLETKSEPVQPPSAKYTSSEALAEMCAAGRQYREDVMVNGATHRQASNEIASYAGYLSGVSPATYSALIKAGQDGLWMDSCGS